MCVQANWKVQVIQRPLQDKHHPRPVIEGINFVYMRIFPTSGPSSCLPREGNRMRPPVFFVVTWLLSVSVHVHLCGLPCIYVLHMYVCVCVYWECSLPSLLAGPGDMELQQPCLPWATICQPLTVWGLLLKTERYKEEIHALKSLQKTWEGYFPFWKQRTKHFKFSLLDYIVNTAGTIWVWFTQWLSATVSRHLLVVLRFSTNVQRSLPWLTAVVQKCHLCVTKLLMSLFRLCSLQANK